MPLTDLNASFVRSFDVGCVCDAPLKKLAVAKWEGMCIFPQLEDLEIRSCADMSEMDCCSAFQAFQNMPLKRLHLEDGPEISDFELGLLSGLHLTDLSLTSLAQITDRGLRHFQGMPLRYLTISGCPYVTEAGVRRIRGDAEGVFRTAHVQGLRMWDDVWPRHHV